MATINNIGIWIGIGLTIFGLLALADTDRYDGGRRADMREAGIATYPRSAGCGVLIMRPLWVGSLLTLGAASLISGYMGGFWYWFALGSLGFNNLLSIGLNAAEAGYLREDGIPTIERAGGRRGFNIFWAIFSSILAGIAWYVGFAAAG